MSGYNISPFCKPILGPQKYVTINENEPVATAVIVTINGTPQHIVFQINIHIAERVVDPNTTTAKTSYDRTEHHNVAAYAPNIIKNPCNAQRQLFLEVALSIGDVHNVSEGAKKSENGARTKKC